MEPQVTAIIEATNIETEATNIETEATNIETEATARSNITRLNTGIQYDKTTDYASNDKVIIGRMIDVCSNCNAQKWGGGGGTTNTLLFQWKGETPTHQGAQLLLKRLLEENNAVSKHFRSKSTIIILHSR